MTGLKATLSNVYDHIAKSGDYQRNENNLKLIQLCVVTVSAIATGFVNSLAHVERLGWPLAIGLALLITGFVEKFYFTLRHGLTTCYQAGKQRLYATICYRSLQLTMVLNAAVLCAWIVGLEVPPALAWWFHWSIAAHFALALIGVSAVRDSDAVAENRMLELKAAAARQDIVTNRKAAAIGNSLVLIAAKIRGWFDAISLARHLLLSRSDFARDYLKQINEIAERQFGHIDGAVLPSPVSNTGNSGGQLLFKVTQPRVPRSSSGAVPNAPRP